MRTIFVLSSLLTLVTPLTALGAQSTSCAFESLDKVNFSTVEASFRRKFCDIGNSASCDAKFANITELVSRLSRDKRIINIATASYILATVSLETGGSSNFSPKTVEKIGAVQKKRSYYPDYIGRGWVQLTHQDKYKFAGRKLKIDLVTHPELALTTDNSYEILVSSMLGGWLETYRSSKGGGAGQIPIRLGDFINGEQADYDSARSVINANCMAKPCTDKEYIKGGFIPTPEKLDNGVHGANNARIFEKILCTARSVN